MRNSLFLRLLQFIICVLCLLSFSSCTNRDNTNQEYNDSGAEKKLCIKLTTSTDYAIGSCFSADELNGNFSHELIYQRVYDVTIQIDGQQEKLEDALRCGLVTEDDIFYFARLDAKAGICQYSAESINGVTSHFFDYPEYNLRLIYDMLEAPDGNQHIISTMLLSPPGDPHFASYIFYDENSNRYDVEDWGLTFTVKHTSPTAITIETSQHQGQQIGQLGIVNYIMVANDAVFERIDDNPTHATFYNSYLPIVMNGTGEIDIDWSEFYGDLPSGNYEIVLYVRDFYENSQIHPLMQDFMDYWPYIIKFTIS